MSRTQPRALCVGAIATALVATWGTPAASAVEQEAPSGVTTEIVSQNGTGCPRRTATAALSNDAQAATMTFGSFQAEVGPGAKTQSPAQTCYINLKFNVPTGWTFSIKKVDYRGFAQIGPGMEGFVHMLMYFSGGRPKMKSVTHFTEGHSGDFSAFASSASTWSPCGSSAILHMGTGISIARSKPGIPDAYSRVSFDSIDSNGAATLGIIWKKC